MNRPLHINLCLDETSREELATIEERVSDSNLIERIKLDLGERPEHKTDLVNLESIDRFFSKTKRPAFVIGPLPGTTRTFIESQLLEIGGPCYFETMSQLAGSSPLGEERILGSEKSLELALQKGWCDGIIRVGGIPTTRVWRDLEEKFKHIPILSFSHLPWRGLAREDAEVLPLAGLERLSGRVPSTLRDWRDFQQTAEKHLQFLKEKYAKSEVALIAKLMGNLPNSSRVYLGNSLPIREVDLNCANLLQQWWVEGNRGANGIDGQLSTFFGFAENLDHNWAVVGDLTALYDLAAPWILNERKLVQANVLVVNNGGGRIFKRMFGRDQLENSHNLHLRGWAEMWNLNYQLWHDIPEELSDASGLRVIELRVDQEQSNLFWQEWDEWWKNQNR